MKNIKKFAPLIVFFVIIITLSLIFILGWGSKKKTYSCDPTINEWVVEHRDFIQQYGRGDLLKFGPEKLKAALIACTVEQKRIFWNNKLQHVIDLKIWNDAEIAHLNALKKQIKTDVFTEEFHQNEQKTGDFVKFEKQWIKTGISQFGWSEKLISAILNSGYDLLDKDGDLDLSTVVPEARVKLFRTESCSCTTRDSQINGCPIKKGFPLNCVQKSTCSTDGTGCGTFQVFPCDGDCN